MNCLDKVEDDYISCKEKIVCMKKYIKHLEMELQHIKQNQTCHFGSTSFTIPKGNDVIQRGRFTINDDVGTPPDMFGSSRFSNIVQITDDKRAAPTSVVTEPNNKVIQRGRFTTEDDVVTKPNNEKVIQRGRFTIENAESKGTKRRKKRNTKKKCSNKRSL